MPSIEGDIVECGVFNGGSAAVMAYAGVRLSSVRRDMWLFDSFDGLPEPGERDHADAWRWIGECRGDPQKVERLDGDWYESTKLCLESFYAKITQADSL